MKCDYIHHKNHRHSKINTKLDREGRKRREGFGRYMSRGVGRGKEQGEVEWRSGNKIEGDKNELGCGWHLESMSYQECQGGE